MIRHLHPEDIDRFIEITRATIKEYKLTLKAFIESINLIKQFLENSNDPQLREKAKALESFILQIQEAPALNFKIDASDGMIAP